MEKILIVRSTSFQHMDGVMDAVGRMFPAAALTILTHAHGEAQARKYALGRNGEHAGNNNETRAEVRVAVYPHRGNFSLLRPPAGLGAEDFQAVVVPVGNDSGSGFTNVFLFTLRVRAGRCLMCNRLLKINEISSARVIAAAAAGLGYSVIAFAAAAAFGIAILAAGTVYSIIAGFGVKPGGRGKR
jgi:hypothetical protein